MGDLNNKTKTLPHSSEPSLSDCLSTTSDEVQLRWLYQQSGIDIVGNKRVVNN